jgi:hypothetical protein
MRSVEALSDISLADVKKVQAVRLQLKDAMRKLDELEFELQGGCLW